eukprot:Rmarinus@m.19751
MSELMDSHAFQFGIMNSLRTGNMVIDVCACAFIPLLLRWLLSWKDSIEPLVRKWIESMWSNRHEYVRTLEYSELTNLYGGGGVKDSKTDILQKALLLYIATALRNKNKAKSLDFPSAEVELMSFDNGDSYGTTTDALKRYQVCILPPKDTWVELGNGIWFWQSFSAETQEGSEGVQKKETVYKLKSYNRTGKEDIEAFLHSTYEWYVETVQKQSEDGRFFLSLTPTASKSDSDSNESSRLYKRYRLSEEKTFDSVFFPEKRSLLRLVDAFVKRSGKFAIKGCAHKLTLLLHGPPGTGKTSVIKSLAEYMGRHIVSIPLDSIRTNQELMDCMFDGVYSIAGEDVSRRLPMSSVIFVMEDVDCASHVVHSRTGTTSGSSATMALETGGTGSGTRPAKKGKRSKPTKDKSGKSTPERGDANGGEGCLDGWNALDGLFGSDDDFGLSCIGPKMPRSRRIGGDRLNLSGILNVLDGVIDCPERVVVMTTNHVDQLDEALVRPGRVNRQLYLGYMQVNEAVDMLQHYFSEVFAARAGMEEAARRRLQEVWPRLSDFTPAQLEQLCMEYESLDDLLSTGIESLYAEPCSATA